MARVARRPAASTITVGSLGIVSVSNRFKSESQSNIGSPTNLRQSAVRFVTIVRHQRLSGRPAGTHGILFEQGGPAVADANLLVTLIGRQCTVRKRYEASLLAQLDSFIY